MPLLTQFSDTRVRFCPFAEGSCPPLSDGLSPSADLPCHLACVGVHTGWTAACPPNGPSIRTLVAALGAGETPQGPLEPRSGVRALGSVPSSDHSLLWDTCLPWPQFKAD